MNIKKISLILLSIFLTSCQISKEDVSSIISSSSIDSEYSVSSSSIEESSSTIESSTESSSFLATWIDYTGEYSKAESEFDATQKIFTKATVRNYVDGDTTHFYVDKSQIPNGVLEARYNGVDTPESTGKIEPWGKAASNFTKEKLANSKSIIVESDNTEWNLDSTGSRYLVWVWYQPETNSDYRCLNLELVQEGLSIAKGFADFTYGPQMQLAYYQAQANKLKVNSKDKDPDFYYGDQIMVSMKELRTNADDYLSLKVRVEGVVTKTDGGTFYATDYDPEDEKYYSFQFYMGFDSFTQVQVGNRLSICGKVSYYETGGTYQVSDLKYYAMRPNHADNLKLLEEGVEIEPIVITGSDLENGAAICANYCKMENLTVTSVYTTTAETSSSIGAMTLTCKDQNQKTVTVRTSQIYHENGDMVVASELEDMVIDVTGIVDVYDSSYQLHVFLFKDIIIK